MNETQEFNAKIDNDSGNETDDDDDCIPCYGNVELTSDEIELLKLGPDFMLTEKLSLRYLEIESQITMTKCRWSRMNDNDDKDENKTTFIHNDNNDTREFEEQDYLEQILKETMEDEEKASRDVIDNSGESINYGRTRATDMTNNRKVIMPGPESPSQEAINETRINTWRTVFQEYIKSDGNKDGTPMSSNLSTTQQAGLLSLSKKN